MTNEELAIRIQQGEKELTTELWQQVERFIKLMANKQLRRLPISSGVEFDDLYNAGYIAVIEAVKYFNPKQGAAYITILSMRLKTAFSEATGFRSRRQQKDPIHYSASLDEVVPGTDDLLVLDTITDPDAELAFEDAEHRIWLEQLRQALDEAFEQLEPRQAGVIKARYKDGQSLRAIGERLSITPEAVRQIESLALRRLRNPRVSRKLKEYIEERTPYYMRVSVERFNSTGTSAVEEAVFWRERNKPPACDYY